MAVLLLLLLTVAFEAAPPLGAGMAMYAVSAHSDWQSALGHNPALAATAPRLAMGAGYWRPYGLEGVDHFGISGGAGLDRWAGVIGLSQLGFDRYRERDFGLAGAYRPFPELSVGAAVHLLTVTTRVNSTEAVVGFDAGAIWTAGRVRFGAAACRFNLPRLRGGDELPATFRAGFSAEPLSDLAVALDAVWSEGRSELALGLELRPLPQLAVRCGGRYPPLGYAAGLSLFAGPVTADYAYRYHPQLRDSHIFGVSFSRW